MKHDARVMVDMSATLIHHGHVRLLKKASERGRVIVALTTDDEILKHKGYQPELTFDQREEILMSLAAVSEVVPSPWLLDNAFLDQHAIDLLVHGSDNSNPIAPERLLILPRTPGVSSTWLRARVLSAVSDRLARQAVED